MTNNLDTVIQNLAAANDSGDKEIEILQQSLSAAIDQLKGNTASLSVVANAALQALGDDINDEAYSDHKLDIASLKVMYSDPSIKTTEQTKSKESGILEEIVNVLSGEEWSPDTPEFIAEILKENGYEIRDIY